MRAIFFLIFFIFIVAGSSVFSEESNTSNGSRNGVPNNNSELFPYGFIFLKTGVDDLILHISEDRELDQLLGSNSSESTKKFDWQNWRGSRNKADSRFLLGGLPFFSIPNNRNSQEQEPTIFSPERFTFFWYFKQKF